jgi:hypothetical protein
MWDVLLLGLPVLLSFLFMLMTIRDWRDSSGNRALIPVALTALSLMTFLGGAAARVYHWELGYGLLALGAASWVVFKRTR